MDNSLETKFPKLGVGVIIIRNKKVLLGLRKGPRSPGKYGLPGGFLENDETIERCALREVEEETGLSQLVIYPIFPLRWSDGKNHYLDFIFLAENTTGEPKVKESDRVEKWTWSDLDHLPSQSKLYKPTALALKRFAHDKRSHKLRLFLQKWIFRQKRIIFFEDGVATNY